MTYNTDQLIAELSDHWYKNHDGNLYKLIDTFNSDLNLISEESEKVDKWHEVKVAQGTTLDLMGENLQAYRPTKADEPFRFLIWLKFLLSHAQGTIPSVSKISSTALQNDKGLQIAKTGTRHISISIPYSLISDLPTEKFILENLQKMLALGIWLDNIALPISTTDNLYVGVVTTVHKRYTENMIIG